MTLWVKWKLIVSAEAMVVSLSAVGNHKALFLLDVLLHLKF